MPQPSECASVKLWRDWAHLNLSASWKHDVEITITDIDLWKTILAGWGYWKSGKWIKKSPAIKVLLDEYDRLSRDKKNAVRTKGSGIHCAESVPERIAGRVSECEMPALLERQTGWQG